VALLVIPGEHPSPSHTGTTNDLDPNRQAYRFRRRDSFGGSDRPWSTARPTQ
jgi:hypothetical protein